MNCGCDVGIQCSVVCNMSHESQPGLTPAAFSVLFMLNPFSHSHCFFVYIDHVSSTTYHYTCCTERGLIMILGWFSIYFTADILQLNCDYFIYCSTSLCNQDHSISSCCLASLFFSPTGKRKAKKQINTLLLQISMTK